MTEAVSSTGKLSALVVVHNEEEMLPGCLETLSFADDIVVVLDNCTDRSREIAERFTDRLLEGSWELEGERRNLGIDFCPGEWVLEIDADERVSDELAAEILSCLKSETGDVFNVPVHNYVGERWIRFGWGGNFGVLGFGGFGVFGVLGVWVFLLVFGFC